MRAALRQTREAYRRARFRAWTTKLDLELRRRGARLILEAGGVPDFDELPHLRVEKRGQGDATFTLRIGTDVSFGRDVTLEIQALGTNALTIGDATMVFDRATFDLDGGSIAIADHCQIRTNTLIKSSAEVTIGARTIFSYNASIHCAAGVELEDWSQIAERVTVVDSDHELDGSDVYAYDRPVNATPIRVGRNTFVGSNSVVTRGARLGRNAAVGACSVVTAGDYPDSWLIAGAPAKPIKSLSDLANRRREAESAV